MTEAEPYSELTDSDLLAYLENDAPPHIIDAIEHSDVYRARVKQLAIEQSLLLNTMYRKPCPEPLELGEYLTGMLTDERHDQIALHLDECPHCIREMAVYHDFLVAAEEQPAIFPNIRIIVAYLVDTLSGAFTSNPLQLGNAGMAARGEGSDDSTLVYTAENGIQVVLNTYPAEQNRKRVKGLLIGTPESRFEIHLWGQDRHIGSYRLEPGAEADPAAGQNFSFDALAPGTYELFIKGNDVLIHIQSFVV